MKLALLATIAVLALAARWYRRKSAEMERDEVEAELMRLWVYEWCGLVEIPEPEVKR